MLGGLGEHEQRSTMAECSEDGRGAAVADDRAAVRQDLRLGDARKGAAGEPRSVERVSDQGPNDLAPPAQAGGMLSPAS